jgi:hypothetical protein
MAGPIGPEYGPFAPNAAPGAGVGAGAAGESVAGVGGAIPSAEAAASGGGRLAGLLGRLPTMEGFAGPTWLGGTGEAGLVASLAPALPPVLAGQAATFGLNKFLPSTGKAGDVRQVLGDAATWAGIGAGVGSVVPGLGTVAGGVSGGIAGGAYGLLDSIFGSGDDKPSPDDIKNTLLASAGSMGLDPKQYGTAFDLLTKNGADPTQLGQQMAVQLLQDAQTQKAITAQQQQQASQQQMDQRFGLAMQAQAQEFFSPYVNNIITGGLSQAEALKGLASHLPPQYKDVMMNQAQQAIAHSQNLAGAYAAQSALIPGQFMAQAELKRETALQQLQYQQAVIAAQQGKASSGASGINQALLQQANSQQQPAPTG